MLKEFAGGSKRTTLASDVTAGALSLPCSDLTGYPTGVSAPFVVVIDMGLAGEEKVLCRRSGNVLDVVDRGYDDTTPSAHSVGGSVDHVIDAITIREANSHINDPGADPHPQYLQAGEIAGQFAELGHTHPAAEVSKKTVRIPHTWTITAEVRQASGDDAFIPPFFIAAPAGQVVRLVGVRHRINSGTSVTYQLVRNGTPITGFTGLVATPTASGADPNDVTLSDLDTLALIVTAVSGATKNLSVTAFLDYEV